MNSDNTARPKQQLLKGTLRFIEWLDHYGEKSYDFQTFYASRLGQWAKALYYRKPFWGTLAVSPIVFCEAFAPKARALFWRPQRFPIADAHYAMAFLFLAKALGEEQYYKRALHFLDVLEHTRCPGYEQYCWGYPFHWVTLRGTIQEGTPLITTVPYVYEAFKQAYEMDGDDRWCRIMRSIAEHAVRDYRDFDISATASTCSYTPDPKDSVGVVNANAYRAFLLQSAAVDFSDDHYRQIAERNLNFVLECQNPDGSWYYANDGKRDFVDHFHTCFVIKALAKIESLTGDSRCTAAIERGVHYYVTNLFDKRNLPKPFSRPPRLIVYRRELYDYAECVNLAVLLKGRFPKLDDILATVVDEVLNVWQRPDGSFRSRQLHLGWDNTPMHRWAQSQMLRSMCFLLGEGTTKGSPLMQKTGAAECVGTARNARWSEARPYVLVTPARNEATFLEKTIESVIHQTVLPLKWAIVDDGSTDNTAEIVRRYLPQYPWMELVQMPQHRDRSFAAKVGAFNAGYERVKGLRWEIIGNLDGDISFDPDHFEFLLGKFAADATLGVAGTVFREEGYSSDRDSFEGRTHVAGQCQLFRRQCWEEIGGYIPHRAGGIDWMAVVTARMMGWKTESFRERWFFHYRRLGTAERGVLSSLFSYGKKDYYLGGHPVWELFRVAYRISKRPFIMGGLALGLGYCWAFLRRVPRPVSRELMAFHRKEQMTKLRAILKSLVRFKRIDNFTVAQH